MNTQESTQQPIQFSNLGQYIQNALPSGLSKFQNISRDISNAKKDYTNLLIGMSIVIFIMFCIIVFLLTKKKV